jgi:membrane protease YdiL (CAAX protease family)
VIGMNRSIFSASIFYLILIVISLAVNQYTDFNILKMEENVPPINALFVGSGVGLGVVFISFLFSRYSLLFKKLEIEWAKIILPISVQNTFFLAVFSALGEELLFRGLLLQKIGLFGSSLLFGAIHFVPKREFFIWTIFAISLGFLLGLLFLLTGQILAPIVCHFIINFINILILRKKYSKAEV